MAPRMELASVTKSEWRKLKGWVRALNAACVCWCGRLGWSGATHDPHPSQVAGECFVTPLERVHRGASHEVGVRH